LSDILQIIGLGKRSGTLILKYDDKRAIIIFKQGFVVGADSDDRDDDIGDELLNAGLITEEALQISRKVLRQLPDSSVGKILLELGYVDNARLEAFSKKRIEKVIYRLLLLKEGDFRFDPDKFLENDPLLKRGWLLKRGISPEYLLMECARIYDETRHYGRVLEEEFPEEQTFFEEDAFPKDISALRSMVQELRFPESISEIFLLILRFASSIYQRGILFSVNEDILEGFGQFGLQAEDADEKIRKTIIYIKKSPLFARLFHSKTLYRGELPEDKETKRLIELIGGEWPEEVVISPIIAEDRVVALLYCDNMPDREPIEDTAALEIFLSQAGMAIEKTLLKKSLKQKIE
jgi:hypothetical protein